MKTKMWKKIIIGVLAVPALLLAGLLNPITTAGADVTESTSGDHGKAFEGKGKGHRGGLASLSGVLGISEDDLRVALKSGESVNDVAERLGVGIDALVANAVAEMAAKADEHGKEFDADVAAVKIAERFKNGLPERNHGKAFEGKGKGHRGGLASLSGVLGISEDDLRVALKSGESVNDVAERLGVGIDALVANAVAEMAAKADEHGKEFDADVAAVKIAERFKNGHPEGKEFAKGSKK